MIDAIVASALLLQCIWMLVYALTQRREVRRLQKRLNALGTELGVMKAKSRTAKDHGHGMEAVAALSAPLLQTADAAELFPPTLTADYLLAEYHRKARPTTVQFSPSWI